ncbi:MAG TPA: hypothetical protein VMI31_12530, partial [Fimbriimonadaceae bacterium]|nr:hypothetical protein [Fimbriimonadaceae bacterium]
PYSGRPVYYRVTVAYYDNSTPPVRKEATASIQVAPTDTGRVTLSSYFPNLTSIEFDSVKVERQFDDVTSLANDDWGAGSLNANPDPYTYKLISPQRGLLLFNPSGYNYYISQSDGTRQPLLGRASYFVADWRVLHEQFQVPASYQYRLAVTSLKVSGEQGPDSTPNQGIGMQSPDANGNLGNSDLVIEDVNTGGVLVHQEATADPTKTSYTVNKSTGLVTFLDADTSTPGLQVMEYEPGATSVSTVTIDTVTLQAFYMGKNEFAVQVLKPAAVFAQTWATPGVSDFYLGGSGPLGGTPSRVYFAPECAGRMVSLGEIYYVNSQNIEVGPVQLTARAEGNLSDISLPYIDVSQYFPDFKAFDNNYPSAVKQVKGASVAVRVLWNPDAFHLTTDPATNMDNLQTWMQGWRKSTVETYLQRGN